VKEPKLSPDALDLGPDVPVLDQSRLLAEFGDDPEILGELRDLFLAHLPSLLQEIRDACRTGDAQALGKSAHSLKGAGSTYGAERLARVCKHLELLGKSGRIEGADAVIELLEQELDKLTAAISQIQGKG
jgi:HPt (histidine-containing phosphotransfer) domain-containing protein